MSQATPNSLTVYVTSWCGDCRRTLAFLDAQQVPYLKVDIDQSAEGRAAVEKLNRGNRSVPTLVFADGSVLVEPSNAELVKKLGGLAR